MKTVGGSFLANIIITAKSATLPAKPAKLMDQYQNQNQWHALWLEQTPNFVVPLLKIGRHETLQKTP